MSWEKPEHEFPEIPVDLTTISDDLLMGNFAVYTAWLNYAATQLANAEIEEVKAEANLRYTQATTLVGSWDATAKDAKVTVAKAERDISPQVVAAEDRFILAKVRRKMEGVMYSNYERCANLMSRELTRRGNGASLERRAGRMLS